MNTKILIVDGRTVEVDAQRYAQLEAMRPLFMRDAAQMTHDAGEAFAYAISQLAYVESQVYEKLYVPMQFREFLPVSTEGGWADTIRYETYDYAGMGKRISGAGHDLPSVEVQTGERIFPVVTGGISYGYTVEEMMKSYMLRQPLSTARLKASLEGVERHLNQVGLFGEGNLTGFYNNASVPQANAATGNWTGATAANLVLADINSAINAVWNNTGNNDYPTDIVMAPSAYQLIASTPINTANGSNYTILKYILENNLTKVATGRDITIRPGFGLNTAGAGSTRRMIAYVKDDSRLKMHVPVELMFLAPQYKGLSIDIPGTYRYSGVEFRYPRSAYYLDGI
jgi:hypothetical protein